MGSVWDCVDMMLRVVWDCVDMMLRVVFFIVLSVAIPIIGFVVLMLLVMLCLCFIMSRGVIIMLRGARMINRNKYNQLKIKLESPQLDDIIVLHYAITLLVVHMMLWMLRVQLEEKMARLGDDLTKLQERLEMAYNKLEYADEEMMIVPYDATNTLFHNLTAVSNDLQDLQDLNDELFEHEDKLEAMLDDDDEVLHWYALFIYVYQYLIFFPRQIKSQNKTLKIIDSRLEDILKQELNDGLTLFNLNTTIEHDTYLVGGIEHDTENLVEKLMITHSYPGVHVNGIVGERGIGKTTLARKIFNHQTIKDKFQSPPPIWVDVHMNSTFHTIKNSIIDKFDDDLIQDEEILVVLNDVNDSKVLKDMIDYFFEHRYLITNACNVLVTTRYESVITHEGIYKHKLPLLSEEDGWALMCKLLFNDGEKGNMQHFEQIGKKMLHKCHGLPLSIKTIARILNTKEKNHSEWEKVLENVIVSLEPSNKTLPKPVYLLLYENLSPYIKQCLIFCAFFPEDYIFDKNILIQQWVVARLVKKPSMSTEDEKEDMQLSEEVANDYYMELLESNILQPATECLYYDDKAMCRMHGSMRSFGQHLIQNLGYFQGDVKALEEAASASPSSSSVQKLHHLVITNHAPLKEFQKIVKNQTSVRTLIFTSKLEITKLPKNLFQKLKLLRILDISGSDCRVLPKSLFKLLHLRHLNLSCLPIKTLPDAIGNLINLQHLILRYCGSLLDLPESITRLQKLRSIDLHQTPLIGMPIGIGQLYQLTSLIGFVKSDSENYCRLGEISYLKELRTLNIVNLEVLNDPKSKVLQQHINLIDLTLSCRGEGQPYTEGEKEEMQECFEYLDPSSSTSIQHIKINGYFGLEFPRWIMDLPFSNLKRLELLKCKYSTELPPLYHFPLLEHLRVEDAWSIKHIDLDTGPWSNVPSLKSLILKDMPEWEEWTWEPCESHLVKPVLELLEIINCPKLKSLPQGLAYHAAKSLDTLTIYKAHSLEKVEGFTSLKTATFFSIHNLSIISDLPATCNFEIDDCPKLDVALLPQTSLQRHTYASL